MYMHVFSLSFIIHMCRDTIPLAAAYTFGIQVTLNVSKEDSLAPSLTVLIPPGIQFANSVRGGERVREEGEKFQTQ